MIHIASVQVDFVPGAVIQGPGLWEPAEPLAWEQGAFEADVSLSGLADRFPAFRSMRKQVESSLVNFQNRRLEQILSFLEKNSVDLCVFPEYAFIAAPSTLLILAGFAPKITIVAGLGVPRTIGVEALAKYTDDRVPQGSNVVAVFSGTECHLISKQHAAEGEEIERGTGIRAVKVHTAGMELYLGVAICKDYLVAGHSLSGIEPVPDLVAIPAYSRNLVAFSPDAPRDFPRIFANHASYGGSTIYAAGCKGRFVEDDGVPRPIPAKAEGIISVKWFGAPEKPVPLLKGENYVALRSAMISGSDGKAAIDVVQAFGQLSQSKASPADILDEELPRWLDYTQGRPRLALVSDALKLYRQAAADDVLTMDMAEQLSRHFVAHETESADAHRRNALSAVIKQLRQSMSNSSDDIEASKVLLYALEKYGEARGDESPPAAAGTDEEVGGEIRHYFSVGLARFTSELAIATLSDQQDLLMMFARSAPEGSRVIYRLKTNLDPATGNVFPRFHVDFFGPSAEESNEYFTSLERISRSVFRRGWSTYSATYEPAVGYRVEITPKPGVHPRMRGDLGFLVDVLRATSGDCTLEISGIRIESASGEDQAAEQGAESKQPGDGFGAIGFYATPRLGTANSESMGDREAIGWFMAQQPSSTKLGIQVILTTPSATTPCAAWSAPRCSGGGDWEVVVLNGADPDAARAVPYPIEVAHRILHPPHGLIEGRGSFVSESVLQASYPTAGNR